MSQGGKGASTVGHVVGSCSKSVRRLRKGKEGLIQRLFPAICVFRHPQKDAYDVAMSVQ